MRGIRVAPVAALPLSTLPHTLSAGGGGTHEIIAPTVLLLLLLLLLLLPHTHMKKMLTRVCATIPSLLLADSLGRRPRRP